MKRIKVLLVDDSSVYRMAIKQNLNSFKEIEIVGECVDGSLVLDFLERHLVDVVLMDVSMKNVGGIEATKLVKYNHPEIKVIALSSHGEPYSTQMFEAGASSFLSKWEATLKQLQQTIISVFEDAFD